MTSYTVSVSWGKETFEVKLIPEGGSKSLKAEIEERTGVPSERMKLMPKSKGLWKGILNDTFDLTSIDFSKLKPPIQILLMGSSSELTGPKVKTVFVEDLPDEEVAKVAPEPSGLKNLGNSCYANSVLQCLRIIPELRSALNNPRRPIVPNGHSQTITRNAESNRLFLSSLGNVFTELDRSSKPVQPTTFLASAFRLFPQFAQVGSHGHRMQQDAEEFYSVLLNVAAQETEGVETIQAAFSKCNKKVEERDLNGATNVIDAVFGIKMEETLTCDEFTASSLNSNSMDVDSSLVEPDVKRYDLHRKLVCNIQGGSDSSSLTNITHIMEGLHLSLNGKVEKRSEVLGRDAVWTRKQRFARLPPVLVVQFGRFYWKETPGSQDHSGVKCKIMKPVAFQSILDVYEFCTDDVQKKLKASRDKFMAEEEERIALKLKGSSKSNSEDALMDDVVHDDELKAALALSLKADTDVMETENSVGPGLPTDFQGKYELFAVVTHKGRDADGGHYMGWVKAEHHKNAANVDEEHDDWFVFDDDEVSPCKTEDILKLKGGGDYHIAYLSFYRAKQ